MKDLAFATIQELSQALEDKKISVSELITYFTQRFAEHDGKLGAALEIFAPETAHPERVEGFAVSKSQSKLTGIPGLIKDNICQKGRVASCASKMLENYQASYDATVVERLKSIGAPLIGRANMDEFASYDNDRRFI